MSQDKSVTHEDAALQKLLLEIDGLRSNNRWNARIGRFIPIITTLIAIAGFWFTLHQYTSAQRRAELQVQEHNKEREEQRTAEQSKLLLEKEERDSLKQEQQLKIAQEREERDRARFQEQRQHELDRDIALANELRRSNEARELEFRKPFWQKQIDLYFEASEAVATMAHSENSEEKLKAEEKFWTLFYGTLVIVEDAEVETAMVNIRNYILECRANNLQCGAERLKNLSLALSSSCRESIGKSWDLKLDQLKGKYKY